MTGNVDVNCTSSSEMNQNHATLVTSSEAPVFNRNYNLFKLFAIVVEKRELLRTAQR